MKLFFIIYILTEVRVLRRSIWLQFSLCEQVDWDRDCTKPTCCSFLYLTTTPCYFSKSRKQTDVDIVWDRFYQHHFCIEPKAFKQVQITNEWFVGVEFIMYSTSRSHIQTLWHNKTCKRHQFQLFETLILFSETESQRHRTGCFDVWPSSMLYQPRMMMMIQSSYQWSCFIFVLSCVSFANRIGTHEIIIKTKIDSTNRRKMFFYQILLWLSILLCHITVWRMEFEHNFFLFTHHVSRNENWLRIFCPSKVVLCWLILFQYTE